MSCPACGEAAAPEASFCIACGTCLKSQCPQCGEVQPSGARYCPGCGARIDRPDGEPAPLPPVSEPSTAADGPSESLGEFIARMRHMEHEHRRGLGAETHRRERRRRVAAVAVVAGSLVTALAVLLGGSWLVLPGWEPSRPVRVATPRSVPGEALTPAPPTLGTRRSGNGVADSTVTRAAREVAAAGGDPQVPTPPAAQVGSTVSQPAGRLPGAPQATASQSERSGPEATAQPPSAPTGSGEHEMAAQIEAEPLADGFTSYTVRLRERDGRPVTGATVSIRGRRADGVVEEAALEPEAEPGLYRAVVRLTFTEARLRVASVGRVQEIPLPDSPS